MAGMAAGEATRQPGFAVDCRPHTAGDRPHPGCRRNLPGMALHLVINADSPPCFPRRAHGQYRLASAKQAALLQAVELLVAESASSESHGQNLVKCNRGLLLFAQSDFAGKLCLFSIIFSADLSACFCIAVTVEENGGSFKGCWCE